MTAQVCVGQSQRRASKSRRRRKLRVGSCGAFRPDAASIHAVVFRVGRGRAFFLWRALLPGWVGLVLAGAPGLGTAACGDANIDAIKMPSSSGGASGGAGTEGTGGKSTGSGGTGGKDPNHTDTGGSGGGEGRHPSGGDDSGGTGGGRPWDTSGGRSSGGDSASGGRGAGGTEPSGGRGAGGTEPSGGRGNGGRDAGGANGGWTGSGGAVGTGGKLPPTGGSMASSTGGVGGGSLPSYCPDNMPSDGGQCFRTPQSPPCHYGASLCYCKDGEWLCAQCPEVQPEASSSCPIGTATCWYEDRAVCYCPMSLSAEAGSKWVCGDTGSDSGAAGASGAGGNAGAAGSASAAGGDFGGTVPASECPAASPKPWELEGHRCDKYGPGAYCEDGSWWCLCAGGYGWHCSPEKPN
jgi:hypothetical protein